jgi:uncharacterized protein YciI
MNAFRAVTVLLMSLLAGCAVSGEAAERGYTLVYLKSGRSGPLPADQQREVFAGHFSNMERLARAGHLLLAGPFGRQRSEPELRGIFVLDTADRDEATTMAETDPGFRAGVFALEYHDFATAAPLRRLNEWDLAEVDAARASGRQPKPGENGRSFVLLVAEDGQRARQALEGRDTALLIGGLDGDGVLAVLDAEDISGAETLLADVRDRLGPHRFEEWFGTRNLERLPRL